MHRTCALLAAVMCGVLTAPAGAAPDARSVPLRKPDAAWLAIHVPDGPNGAVTFSGRSHKGYYRAYACPDVAAATSVIAAIPDSTTQRATAAQQGVALKNALQAQKCAPAKGRYRIALIGAQAEINHGVEASEEWTAISAVDSEGRTIGLVFDASVYAITD